MGLDMYLEAEKYLSSYDDEDKEIQEKIKAMLLEISSHEPKKIVIEGAYWRKANQIHNWFVNKVQEGEDDCKRYYVDREQLKELLKMCKAIIDEPDTSSGLLPTVGGFFFGSTDYDEGYMEDIKDTVMMLEDCLKLPEDWEFYYHSSW